MLLFFSSQLSCELQLLQHRAAEGAECCAGGDVSVPYVTIAAEA